jgi:hypothetical protein
VKVVISVIMMIKGGKQRDFVFTWLEGGLHAAIPASCSWGSFGFSTFSHTVTN